MLNLTPLLRLYATFRNSQLLAQDPTNVQAQTLRSLLHKARLTQFGKDYSFHNISTVDEYQSRVPLRTYEDFWEQYWKGPFPNLRDVTWPGLIPYFPVSSGTSSGTTKYIPYTNEMKNSNTKAGMDLLVHHVSNKPQSRIMGGKNFMLGGSTDFVKEAPGVWSGDLSGISVKELPWWIRPRYFPPQDLALISDWEEKIDVLGTEALKADIRMISGVPSWLLIFFDKLADALGHDTPRACELFPNLELLVHGGVNFAPYFEQFQELLEGSHAELREVYPASEGFIASADRGSGEGLRMVLDHGIFYEFVPVDELSSPNPTRHWIKTVEKDVNYAIVLTTCAGIWSYILGDTVRFIDTETPRLLITGRTSYMLSAFGEHVIAEEVEYAVSNAAHEIGETVSDYSVGALFPQNPGDLGGHLYVVEFTDGEISREKMQTFLNRIDQDLCKRNEDYEAHRAEGFGLKAPQAISVPQGTFAAWMKKRGKLGGQNKVPRIISRTELFDDLKEFVGV